jgi:hypothetical protein
MLRLTVMSLVLDQDQPFDAEIAHAVAEAYHEVCKHLHDRGQPEIVREIIFEKLTNAAKDGERDPARLRDIVLKSFGLKRDGAAV